MKNLLLTLCLSLTISVSLAQSVFEKVLSNEIKFALSDGVRFDDGNWMFSAFAYSFTPGDSAMAMVVKTDSTFRPLWSKRYKTLRRDDFSCITPLSDGNVLVGGAMRQDFSLQNGGSVLKLDTAGNVLWHMMYDETFDDRVLDIFEQADSSLMIFIREGVTNRPTKVIHANKDGNILNQRTFTVGTNMGLLANNVVADENEQYYFSGSVFEQGTSELFVCAVDDSNLVWFKRFRFDERSVSSFNSAYNPADQSIILGGTILDTVGIFVNIWLAKIDLLGNVLWSKEYGQDFGYTESASAIKPFPNGDFMMFGRVFDDQGSEGFAMRLDPMGNKIWERGYNPTSPTFGIGDAFFLPDGKMFLTGNSGEKVYLLTTSAEGENACSLSSVSFNIADLSVVDSIYPLNLGNPGLLEFVPPLEISDVSIQDSLLCAASVGVEVLSKEQLDIFPNPVQDQLTVVLPESGNHRFECTIIDALGRKINPKMLLNANEILIDVRSIPTGIYWLYLNSDGKVFSQSFVRQ
ncbi:MAG: T9SS type A sorting domain-containing protein [Bacteroidia bacterium]